MHYLAGYLGSIKGLVEVLGSDALGNYCRNGCLGWDCIDKVKMAQFTESEDEPEDEDEDDVGVEIKTEEEEGQGFQNEDSNEIEDQDEDEDGDGDETTRRMPVRTRYGRARGCSANDDFMTEDEDEDEVRTKTRTEMMKEKATIPIRSPVLPNQITNHSAKQHHHPKHLLSIPPQHRYRPKAPSIRGLRRLLSSSDQR